MNRSQPVGHLGGGGWRTSSTDPRPGETRKGKKKREQVLNAMVEMFIENIEYSIIENVVQSCDYSDEQATEALLSMCSDVSSHSSPKATTSVKTTYPASASGLEVIRNAYGGEDCVSDVNFEDSTEERAENSWQEVTSQRGSSAKMYRIKCPDLPPQSKRESSIKPKDLVKPGTSTRNFITSAPPQKSVLNPNVQPFKISTHAKAMENINYYITEGMKLLILMRGCPGSGKSYFANNLILSIGGKTEEHVYSTDDFFSRNGPYVFRIEKLQEAHQWNQRRVLEALRKGCSPIVVDNTHTMMWEMNAYAVMGVTNGYCLEILEPPTPWFFNEAELARRNRHGVPRDKIHTMLNRYEKNVTADHLIKAAGLSYFPRNLPPQPAARPIGKKRTDLHIDSVGWQPFPYQMPRCQDAISKEQVIISGSNPNHSAFIPSQPKLALDTTAYQAASCSEMAYGDSSNQNVPNILDDGDLHGRDDAELQDEPGNSVSEFFSKFKKEKGTISEVKSGNEMIPPVSSEDVAQVCSSFESLTTKGVENVELAHASNSSDDSTSEELLEINLPIAHCIDSQTECESHVEESASSATDTSEEENWSTTGEETSGSLCSSPEEPQVVLREVESDKIIHSDGMLLQNSNTASTSGMSDNFNSSSSTSSPLTPLEKNCQDATKESLTNLDYEDTRSVDFVVVSLVPTDPSDKTEVTLDESQIINEAVSIKTEEATCEEDYSWVMGSSWIETKPSPTEDSFTNRNVLPKENPFELVPKEQREKRRCSPVCRKSPNLESFEERLEVGTSHEPSEWSVSDDATASWQTIEKNQEEFYGNWQEKKSDVATPLAQRSCFDKNGKSHCSVQEASTNTHHSDFLILSNLPLSGLESNIKLLNAFDRSINEGTVKLESKIPLKFMLDKGTTIDNDLPISIETKGSRDKLAELIRLFPNEAPESLKELLENCQWDINWASNCLLDTNCDGLGASAFQGNLNVEDLVMSVPCDIEGTEECQNQDALPDTPIHYETVKKNDSEASKASALALKRHIEESIVMSEESYSPFVLQIKNIRRGLNIQSPNVPVGEPIENRSSTPSSISSGSRILSQESTDDEKRAKSEEDETEEEEEEDEEESLEFILSQDFIQQLMDKFGPSGSWHPPSMSPVVKFPMSLARQIHYHVVMSQQQHEDTEYAAMQNMCQRDEEIARQMYEDMEQQSKVSSPSTPQLQEIMDMEMAKAIYNADIESLNRNSEDTIASVLAKRLLQDMFPKIDNKVLQDVLRAHNNSFEETVNVLQQSLSNSDLSFSAAQREKELLEKVKRTSMRATRETHGAFDTDIENPETAMADAQGYREEAARLLEERRECYRKAQESFQRGQRSVAAYYSQLGNVLKKQIDQSNARAASAFVSAHALEKSPYTLDLHYLHVAEAIQVLDMFLDHHITKLYSPGQGQEWLYIITGRGARSTNGLSRIKPAVVQRLKARKLEFKTENPGLLKVSVTRNTPLACKMER